MAYYVESCDGCMYHTDEGCSWNQAQPWPAPCEEEVPEDDEPDDWEDWE